MISFMTADNEIVLAIATRSVRSGARLGELMEVGSMWRPRACEAHAEGLIAVVLPLVKIRAVGKKALTLSSTADTGTKD